MKRILSMILALTMCICMIPAVSAASDLPFTDVPVTEWYYNDVKTAYESGLINGKSATTYEPESLLLYCEAVKLAACMHQKYTAGAVTLGNGTPQWYSSYVDYAILNSIIFKEYAWEFHATRAGYMEIFASALPDEALPVINNVPAGSIPDVPVHHPQAAAIYKLYRAGILQGNDAVTHICKPDENIKRSEVAAILTRMMDPTKRVKFSMGDPMEITVQPKDAEDIEKNGSAVFTVKAKGGAAPYSYRWQMKSAAGADWKDLNDASTGIYKNNGGETDTLTVTVTNVGNTVGYLYRCIITDSLGETVTSDTVRYTIKAAQAAEPLTITTQPKDNYDGRPDVEAEFTVKASGGKAPYTYQWQWMRGGKWENPLGYLSAKTDTFAMSLTMAGDTVVELRCIVTDANGDTVTSEIAHFQVPASDLSVDMLSSHTVKANETVLFTVDAVTGGVAPYTYKWMYDVDKDYMFKDIPGAGNSEDVTFKFTEAELDKGIRIVLEVTDADGNKVTKFCQLVKQLSGLTITTQPKDNYDGRPDVEAKFTVKASGGKAPYSYQWQWMRGGKWENPIGYLSAKTDTFAMSLTTAGDTVVELRCIVTDADGDTVTSEIAHFQVPKSDLAVDMLSSNTVKANESVLFTVDGVTGGVAPYTYKWMYDVDKDYMFKDIPGAGNSKDVYFKFTEAELDKGIRIVLEVTDADGNKVTKFCQLVKLIPEFRLAGTTKLAITHGNFNIAAIYATGGKEPYTYKWQYKNPAYNLHKDWTDVHKNYGMGSVFTGLIDSNQLMVTGNVNTFVNGMLLRCIVTDADGKQLTSNEIPVTVNVADLKVESLPANIVVDHLKSSNVSAKVSGGVAPYTYDWYVRYTPTSTPTKIHSGGGMQYTFTAGIGTADLTFVPAYDDSTNGMILWCEITDAKGTKVTTDYAKITVRKPVAIQITQNLSAAESMIRGYDQTLYVKAYGGSGKLSYAWQYNTGSGWKNCTDTTYFMKGYTSDTLSIVPTLESYVNGAKFRCVISDQGGQTVYSNETKLTVKERMAVLADLPESAEFNLPTKSSSGTLTFTVSASNSVGKLDYIWQYKDASNSTYRPITAAQTWATINGNTITIRATRALTDTYPVIRCVFQDELAQNAWTKSCRIEPKNVFITKQPQNVSVSARGTNAVSFDVEADGGLAPYTYQWEFMPYYESDPTYRWWTETANKFGISNGLKNSFINVKAGYTQGHNVADIGHFAARVTVRDAQGSKVTSNIAFLLP